MVFKLVIMLLYVKVTICNKLNLNEINTDRSGVPCQVLLNIKNRQRFAIGIGKQPDAVLLDAIFINHHWLLYLFPNYWDQHHARDFLPFHPRSFH